MSEEFKTENYKHRNVFLPTIQIQKIKYQKLFYANDKQEEDMM